MLSCSHEQIRVGEAVELLVLSTSPDFDDFMAVKEARLPSPRNSDASGAFTEFWLSLSCGGTICQNSLEGGCLTACVRAGDGRCTCRNRNCGWASTQP